MIFRPGMLAAVTVAVLGLAPTARADELTLHVHRAFAAVTAPGDLDVSFSGDGKQTTDFGGSDAAAAAAVQADGKIVVAGSSGGNFALARYGADGALDLSFSGDGVVTTD